jgi:hypothetical protein
MRDRLALTISVTATLLLLLLLGTMPASAAPTPEPSSGLVASRAAAKAADRILDQHTAAPAAERLGGPLVTRSDEPMPQSTAKPANKALPCTAGKCASVVASQIPTTEGSGELAQDVEAARALQRSANVCSTTVTKESRWHANSRTSGCAVIMFKITVTQMPSKKVVGRSTLFALLTMAANGGTASFSNTAYVWVSSYSGEGAPSSMQGELITICDKVGCEPRHLKWGHAGESYAWNGSADLAMYGMKKNQSSNTGGYWAFTASSPEWSNLVDTYIDIGTGRCDDAVGGYRPGCVIPTYRPTWAIPIRDYPAFTSHVDSALGSGLPGTASKKSYLKRMTSKSKGDKNGRTACPSNLDRPKGYSCDEYPFRSTYQGAYYGNTAKQRKARSFPGCQMDDPKRTGRHGWSRCFIPEKQNSGAGGALRGFYGAQRVLNKDKFYVGFSS